jgi:ParB-like chromosome segregation protein Spo0J
MQIKEIEVSKLIPYANNSRTHDDAQVAQLAASIKEFGFRNPILVDGVGIIAGHGRLMAARKLGLNKVPTIDCSDMTETQKKAYIIADNKLALNSGWDSELLKLEINDLQNTDFDLTKLGFSEMELANLFDELKDVQIDDLNYQAAFSIVVDCKDEQEQEKIFNELDQKGYKCRVQSL